MDMFSFILSTYAWAGSVDVFQAQPIVPNGESQYTIQLRVPDILPLMMRFELQSIAGSIDAQSIDSDGLITVKSCVHE